MITNKTNRINQINLEKLINMDLNEIILLKRMRASSIIVSHKSSREAEWIMRKSMSMQRKFAVGKLNDKNIYYNDLKYVPITVEELLKVFMYKNNFSTILNHIESSSRLNEKEFVEIYKNLGEISKLDEMDLEVLELLKEESAIVKKKILK